MSIAHTSVLFPFLESLGLSPKRGLSQNFLIDANIIRNIVDAADISPEDHVLEIGPGPGALTEELLKRGAFVTAIEKDRLFAKHLHRLQNGHLTVLEGDVLKICWPSSDKPWKILGNLPYHITTPILERTLSLQAQSFTFMVQKEFADRLQAPLGSRNCGSISLFVQAQAYIQKSFSVSRHCFYPAPKVDSTVLHLIPSGEKDPEDFFALARLSFQKRRKMLSSSLRPLFEISAVQKALRQANAPITARPEELTLLQWRTFFLALQTEKIS